MHSRSTNSISNLFIHIVHTYISFDAVAMLTVKAHYTTITRKEKLSMLN